ncbi:MAG: hypothetical protein OQL19_19380, partial [Gammaproteobacteria bacterium]|nr:hypothetical protein [Gammaproteobacteria bacterium]
MLNKLKNKQFLSSKKVLFICAFISLSFSPLTLSETHRHDENMEQKKHEDHKDDEHDDHKDDEHDDHKDDEHDDHKDDEHDDH